MHVTICVCMGEIWELSIDQQGLPTTCGLTEREREGEQQRSIRYPYQCSHSNI